MDSNGAQTAMRSSPATGSVEPAGEPHSIVHTSGEPYRRLRFRARPMFDVTLYCPEPLEEQSS